MLTHFPARAGTLAVMSPDKRSARAALLAARRTIAPEARAQADEQLLRHLAAGIGHASRVAAYVPVNGEPGGAALPQALREQGFAVLLPILLPDLDLDWALYDGRFNAGPRGLREPASEPLGIEAIGTVDVVVVPALAVDRTGVRLGRGGGSYDRALARLGAGTLTVALLYAGEWVEELPREPHDQTVRAVVTPEGWFDLPAQPIATPR
jgi:5-formyltetrahydrofolate cyclo-ligase